MNPLYNRVVMSGNSQAVPIPATLRLSTDRVLISRNAEGDLLMHPFDPEDSAICRQDALQEPPRLECGAP